MVIVGAGLAGLTYAYAYACAGRASTPRSTRRAPAPAGGIDSKLGQLLDVAYNIVVGGNDQIPARMAAARLQYGCVWVNQHVMLATEMPHGGLKMSGYGSVSGEAWSPR